jgi:hypothetical protein
VEAGDRDAAADSGDQDAFARLQRSLAEQHAPVVRLAPKIAPSCSSVSFAPGGKRCAHRSQRRPHICARPLPFYTAAIMS